MKYKISELAKLLDVSTNTIRRYEKKGYFEAVPDDKSGYKYYEDDSVFNVINAKLLRKYGFSHEEIDIINDYNLDENIHCFEEKMKELDEKLAYYTYVRHRMKDDLVLMRKIQSRKEVYEAECTEMVYVLYSDGKKLLMEPERLQKIKEFLYDSPEVQRVYFISKEDFDNNTLILKRGWAIKDMHMEKYHMTESDYTVRYKAHRSVMQIVKVPLKTSEFETFSNDEIKNMLLKEHLEYINNNNLEIAGDIIAVVITKVKEEGKEVVYFLVSIPVDKCSGGGTDNEN